MLVFIGLNPLFVVNKTFAVYRARLSTPRNTGRNLSPVGVTLGALLLLPACNWVDSTGVQTGTISPSVVGSEPPNLDGIPIRTVAMEENLPADIVPSIGVADLDSDWAWGAPYQTGALPACTGVGDFDNLLSVPTLADACTSMDDCDISFDFFRDDADQAGFRVTLPSLRANIGLAYQLSATDSEGKTEIEYLTLCAISVNEGPIAQDDIFDVIAGTTTTIANTDQVNLLSNDFDDVDIRNLPLAVKPLAIEEPGLAEQFELFDNGGFSYTPAADLEFPATGPLFDSFVYVVTDGDQDSKATVTLRIRSSDGDVNSAPVISPIDDEIVSAGKPFTIEISADDVDQDPLQFSLSADSPDFVEIDPLNGTMTGSTDTPGSYTITVIASDGKDQGSASFMLFVLSEQNRPPYADDIQNKTVTGEFRYDVSGFFGDPDGDPLTFNAVGLPADTRISTSGVITGEVDDDNEGRYIVRVFVDDGRGGTASDGFRLILKDD